MKKHLLIFVLLLALLAPCALAEEAYVPGNITKSLYAEALDAGHIITADLGLSLSMDPAAFDVDESDEALFSAALSALENATLSIGMGPIENGVRLELGAVYAPQDAGEQADMAAALNITRDGLLLESSLIEGESVYASWDTLLTMAGMEQSQIMMFKSLMSMDMEATLALVSSMVTPYIQQVGALLTPYGETLLAFVDTLDITLEENPEILQGYPETDKEVIINITAEDIRLLVTALADQLEQDAQLSPLLDSLIAMQEPGDLPFASTAELCELVRSSVASMKDTSRPLTIYVGYDAQENPIYLSASRTEPDGTTLLASLISYPTANDASISLLMDVGAVDADQALLGGVSAALDIARDAADEQVFDSTASFAVYDEDSTLMSFSMNMGSTAITTADQLPGYQITQTMNMAVEDEISENTSSQYVSAMTSTGGEYISGEGTVTMEEYGQTITTAYSMDIVTIPRENGPTTSVSYIFTMPDLGVNVMAIRTGLHTAAYDPASTAALTQTVVDPAAMDSLNTLLARGQSALATELSTLLGLLPPELTQAMLDTAE